MNLTCDDISPEALEEWLDHATCLSDCSIVDFTDLWSAFCFVLSSLDIDEEFRNRSRLKSAIDEASGPFVPKAPCSGTVSGSPPFKGKPVPLALFNDSRRLIDRSSRPFCPYTALRPSWMVAIGLCLCRRGKRRREGQHKQCLGIGSSKGLGKGIKSQIEIMSNGSFNCLMSRL